MISISCVAMIKGQIEINHLARVLIPNFTVLYAHMGIHMCVSVCTKGKKPEKCFIKA